VTLPYRVLSTLHKSQSVAGSPVLDGRLGDPPLPSRTRHPEFLAQVTEPQVFVNAS
jgi:hypothetical protein